MKDTAVMLSSFFCIIFLHSCKKEKTEGKLSIPFDWSAFYTCSNQLNPDSLAITDTLPGNWNLLLISNPWSGDSVPAASVSLNFGSGNTFTVTENGNVVSNGMYQIQLRYNYVWELNATPLVHYLSGSINICGNRIAFSNSDVDGAAHLFERY